ncbi:hypothetical protein ASF36_23355 [Methylobacterium sp. Leaf90]|nr:hypothetical protein ASF36_23355 [Methylobacterium sp. Leaf90]
MEASMNVQPAPVWDYLRSALRGHRTSGAVDHRVGAALDEYLGHLARCVADGEVTLAEGLVLGNAVISFAGRCSPLPEARHAAR